MERFRRPSARPQELEAYVIRTTKRSFHEHLARRTRDGSPEPSEDDRGTLVTFTLPDVTKRMAIRSCQSCPHNTSGPARRAMDRRSWS